MIGAGVGLALPCVAVWLALSRFGLRSAIPPATVRLGLAVGGGMGLSALTTFWLIGMGLHLGRWSFLAVDAGIWSSLAAGIHLSTTSPQTALPSRTGEPHAGRATWVVRGVFALAALASVVALVQGYSALPHGDWDAWAIWNQKARFLYRGGTAWADVLAIGWSQPSHPLLLPLTVARLWTYAGSEFTIVPAALGILFGTAIVICVIGTLGPHRTRSWVAGTVLLAPGTFLQAWTAQQADIPFAFFMIAAMVALAYASLATDGRRLGLALAAAGLMSGLSAWTKSEGLLLLLLTAGLAGVTAVRRGYVGAVAWWLVGALPSMLTVVWFRRRYATEGPYYLPDTPLLQTVVDRFSDTAHRARIGDALWTHASSWGDPTLAGIVPIVALAALVVACTPRGQSVRVLLVVPLAMMGGYYGIYMATSLDASWLIATTFHRLLSQLWPSLVLFAFLTGPIDRRTASCTGAER